MASKDYDDFLESFMNNSAKVYNEDKKNLEKEEDNVPAAYNIDKSSSQKNNKSFKRGRVIEKEMASGKKSKKHKNKIDETSTKFKVFRVLLGIFMVIAVVCVVCVSVVAIYAYSVIYGDPVFDLTEEKYSQNQTSFIYAYDKNDNPVELTRLHGEENRIWVNLADMSPYMKDAVIATEDKRFESHNGVDWIRTVGVIVKPENLGQGGSTITQQLVKNLTDEKQVTISRKFNEILYAMNLERHYNKDEIVEAYLNTIYLGHGCYGVKTASEKYFGKEVADLNVSECASLVSITKNPSKYDPLRYPESNRKRQLWILGEMKSENLHSLTEKEYNDAVAYKMIFTNSPDYQGSQIANSGEKAKANIIDSWYVDYVISTVIEDLQKEGYTYNKAKSMVYGGGLKIYSAMDFDVQDSLEYVYENYKKMPDETVQGAMAIMNYQGRVLGIVGGTGKKKGALEFNRAVQAKRSPGSTIKPISVYAPALEKSLTDDKCDFYWSKMIPDKPLKKINGKWWPKNESNSYSYGNITLQYGLAKSRNTTSAQTLDGIGVDYSYKFLSEKFHISTLDFKWDCDYAPMATGSLTHGASVLEMTAAYATFGNGGQYYYPYCYYKIEDSQGNVIIKKNAEDMKEQALSESTAWIMNKLLQTVMTKGTGTSYKLSNIECFGKTGTTTESKDRWFIGGTPQYVAAVWYGYDIQKEIRYSLSPNPSGTLWKTVMTEIYKKKGTDVKKFPEYDGIVRLAYDPSNGLLAKYSSGSYGWYDKNNLPAYSSNSAPKTSTSSSESTSASSETTSSAPPTPTSEAPAA